MTTNYEKIKAMSVEDMAEWFVEVEMQCFYCVQPYKTCTNALVCKIGHKQWLESEATE